MQGWHESNWEKKPDSAKKSDVINEDIKQEIKFYASSDRMYFNVAQTHFDVKSFEGWSGESFGVKVLQNTILKSYDLPDSLESYAMEEYDETEENSDGFVIHSPLFVIHNIWAPDGVLRIYLPFYVRCVFICLFS